MLFSHFIDVKTDTQRVNNLLHDTYRGGESSYAGYAEKSVTASESFPAHSSEARSKPSLPQGIVGVSRSHQARAHVSGPWAAVKLSQWGSRLFRQRLPLHRAGGTLERGLVVSGGSSLLRSLLPCVRSVGCTTAAGRRLKALGPLAITCLQTTLALQDPRGPSREAASCSSRPRRRALGWRDPWGRLSSLSVCQARGQTEAWCASPWGLLGLSGLLARKEESGEEGGVRAQGGALTGRALHAPTASTAEFKDLGSGIPFAPISFSDRKSRRQRWAGSVSHSPLTSLPALAPSLFGGTRGVGRVGLWKGSLFSL